MNHYWQRLLGLFSLLTLSPLLLATNLGELSVQSSLGQPFTAATEVFSPYPHQAQDLSAQVLPLPLADSATRRILAGIEARVSNQGSRVVVSLRGNQSLNLPLLQFRLALSTPEQRLIREYDVLFDLPLAIDSRPAANQPTSQPKAATAPTTGKSVSAERVSYGPVVSGDTLWQLAKGIAGQRNQDSNTVLQQLHAENPHAFINGDINRLKTGVMLTLPASATASGLQQGVVQSAKVAESAALPASAVSQAASTGPVEQAASTVQSSQLTRALQQQQRLQARYRAQQARIEELNRRLAANDASGAVLEPEADTPVDKAIPNSGLPAEQAASALQPAAVTETDSSTEPAPVTETNSSTAGELEQLPPVQAEAAWKQIPARLAAALAALTTLLFSWQLLAATVALVLVAVAAISVMYLLNQRRHRRDQQHAEEHLRAAVSEKADRQQEREREYRQMAQQTLVNDAIKTDEEESAVEGDQDDELDNLLQIADVQIAYEEFDEAELTLHKAIERQPDDGYPRFRLIQLYEMTDNRIGFLREARQLAGRKATIDAAIWQEVLQLGAHKYPQEALFADALATRSEVIDFDSFANRVNEGVGEKQHSGSHSA